MIALGLLWALTAAPPVAASPSPVPSASPPVQTTEDEYTRYELLAPGTGRFRVLFEVTAATAGARTFFNPIRKGSTPSEEAVYDRMTGQALPIEIVAGSNAIEGGIPSADKDARYIKVTLPRAVPASGGVRLLVDKTYTDPKTYLVEGEDIVFTRTLGVRRNAVVLPKGYELVACNVPAQVVVEADGRVRASFINATPADLPVVLRGRPLR